MSKKHKVFVYGTLRPSKEGTHILPGYEMFEYSGGTFSFPYITASDDDGGVVGNLVEVNDEELAELDKYEGVDKGLYVRDKVHILDLDDTPIKDVWVYVAGPALLSPAVPSGDWFNR